ncbi:MAG: hypothetical protein V5B78_10690 [Desulfohalobiaceae bacterium]
MDLRTAAVLALVCLASVGCGPFSGVKDVSTDLIWNKELQLEGKSELGPLEQRMARIVHPVDTRLQSLIEVVRTMEPENGDPPDLTGVVSDFTWVKGAAAVGLDGEVRESRPENGDASPALAEVTQKASEWDDRGLHALYGKSRYGADVVLLKGMYSGGEKTGYLVVSLDFSALVEDSPRARELVAVSRENVLWAGSYEKASERLAATDWEARLESGIRGRRRVGDRNFMWMARYIGQKPFFYAVEITRYN